MIDGVSPNNLLLDTNEGIRIFSNGSSYFTQRGAGPKVWDSAGTLQPSHIVWGTSPIISGGGVGIGFSGNAVFSSAGSYSCTVSPIGAPGSPTAAVIYGSGASMAILGSNGVAYSWICIGN